VFIYMGQSIYLSIYYIIDGFFHGSLTQYVLSWIMMDNFFGW